MNTTPESAVANSVRRWVQEVVVGLELCPFAGREVKADTIRYAVCTASTEEALLEQLAEELLRLRESSAVETTLLIHPGVLGDFADYNDFLWLCDQLIESLDMRGEFQIASFHPDYRFDGAEAHAPENFSNRSPYPMLHILREESVENAVANYPNIESIPERNTKRLRAMGLKALEGLTRSHLSELSSASPAPDPD
ncbi:MAG: DUF1415 domain-containing protein [Halieaceae bacterium]|jgi:hypothetical protein|nr:DUF1415 domain-containing protein [Halieaceae bacterium]